MKLNIQVADYRLIDILICALEGGSNYWYQLENQNDDYSKPYWERVFENGLTISNAVSGDSVRREAKLTRESMKAGLVLMQELYPHHFADFISEQDDAATADVWLQLSLFGEVLYG